MDKLNMRFPAGDTLENKVVGSARLLSLIPESELAPKVAAYEAAKRAAKAAVAAPAVLDDVTEEVHTALRAGKDVDAAAVVQRLAQQAAHREARNTAVQFFRSLPEEYKYDVA